MELQIKCQIEIVVLEIKLGIRFVDSPKKGVNHDEAFHCNSGFNGTDTTFILKSAGVIPHTTIAIVP